MDAQEAKGQGPGNEEAGLFPRETSLTGPGLAGACESRCFRQEAEGGSTALATPSGAFFALGKGCGLTLPSWKATQK